jgi:hypothetical protein
MVHWFDPGQLLSTGVKVLISAAIAQRSDYRTMEDVGPPQEVFDYSQENGKENRELWFDYLADTGDGWNPTYAIASLVAQEALAIGDLTLKRGRFLVLGGDEVYPVGSKENYRDRFKAPFEAALPETKPPHPDLFAIPGNHDWYDGLVSFSRRFTQERWIGGWATRQRRSYFALQLPHRWWLWALDVQLESDIDLGQRDYFGEIAQQLQEKDRVILLSHEPEWLFRDIKNLKAESNLAYLEEKIIAPCEAEVYLWLAGHIHHYRRHQRTDNPNYQRITSGAGGTYVAPTHRPLFGAAGTAVRRTIRVGTGRAEERFELQCSFPSPSTSFRLSLLNCFFLVKNWRFGLLTGLAYATLTWGQTPKAPPSMRSAVLVDLVEDPARLFWVLLVLAGFVFYADDEFPLFRWIGGLAHGVAHIACALLIAYWAAMQVPETFWAPLYRLGLILVGGGIAGPIIMGLYLLIAANLFGAHPDHAFAALRIEDYKHFLRLHITRDGALDIFPIAIEKIPRGKDAGAQYRLIEEPITIRPPGLDC